MSRQSLSHTLASHWLLLASGAIVVAFVLPYTLMFAPGGLSKTQGPWADFGQYLGGAVGPMLSLVTIYLLIRTLAAQQDAVSKANDALVAQQSQNIKSDLFNRAQVVYEELNRVMDTLQVNCKSGDVKSLRAALTDGHYTADFTSESYGENKAPPYSGMTPFKLLLRELADYLDAIDQLSGGDRRATNYFRRRLETFVYLLSEVKRLDIDMRKRFVVQP